jgi:RND family efflux transporter MFP subunit
MKKKNILKILVVVILLALGWLFFVRPKDFVKAARKIEVQNKKVIRTVSTSGEVTSDDKADLAFSTTGKIQNIKVVEGDSVKKGDLLATVDSYAAYQTAQSLKDARDYAIRERDLYMHEKPAKVKAAGGETEYDLHMRQLNERVDQAEAGYQAQLGLVSNYYMYAPFDGTILDITKKAGETATIGEPIIKIGNLNNFVFQINVDQEDFGLLKENMAVQIKLDSFDGFEFSSMIQKLPFFANDVTKTFEVKIPMTQDKDHPIKYGMEGDAYVTLQSTQNEVKALTLDEIFYDVDDKPFVWIQENEKLAKKYIETGIEGDIYVEVKTDLPSYVLVPVSDKDEFTEGFKVKLIN